MFPPCRDGAEVLAIAAQLRHTQSGGRVGKDGPCSVSLGGVGGQGWASVLSGRKR